MSKKRKDIHDLDQLITRIDSTLRQGAYVYVTVPDTSNMDDQHIVCTLVEDEGISVILKQHEADRLRLSYDQLYAWITLQVYSSLTAVGFTAAFATALGYAGISCNVIAGYYHDHIMVPYEDADRALQTLKAMNENK